MSLGENEKKNFTQSRGAAEKKNLTQRRGDAEDAVALAQAWRSMVFSARFARQWFSPLRLCGSA
jgi:hypothetical protein